MCYEAVLGAILFTKITMAGRRKKRRSVEAVCDQFHTFMSNGRKKPKTKSLQSLIACFLNFLLLLLNCCINDECAFVCVRALSLKKIDISFLVTKMRYSQFHNIYCSILCRWTLNNGKEFWNGLYPKNFKMVHIPYSTIWIWGPFNISKYVDYKWKISVDLEVSWPPWQAEGSH